MTFSDLSTKISDSILSDSEKLANMRADSQYNAARTGGMDACIGCGAPATRTGCQPNPVAAVKGRIWSCANFKKNEKAGERPAKGVTQLPSAPEAMKTGRATVIQTAFLEAIEADKGTGLFSTELLKRSDMDGDRLSSDEREFAVLFKEARKDGMPRYAERLFLPKEGESLVLRKGENPYNLEGRNAAFWAFNDKCYSEMDRHPLLERVVEKMIEIGYKDRAAVMEQFRVGRYTLPPMNGLIPAGLPGSIKKLGNKTKQNRFREGAIMVNMIDEAGQYQASQTWNPFKDLWNSQGQNSAYQKYGSLSNKDSSFNLEGGHAPYGVRIVDPNGEIVVIAEGTNKGNKLAYQLQTGMIDLGRPVAKVILVPGNYYHNYADILVELTENFRLDVVMGIDAGAGLNRSVGMSMAKFSWIWRMISGRECFHTDWGQITGSKELPDIDELYVSDRWKLAAKWSIKYFDETLYAGFEVCFDGSAPENWKMADIMDPRSISTHNRQEVYEALSKGDKKRGDLYLAADKIPAGLIDKAVIRVGEGSYPTTYNKLKGFTQGSLVRLIAERKVVLKNKADDKAVKLQIGLGDGVWDIHDHHLKSGKVEDIVLVASWSNEARTNMAKGADYLFPAKGEEGLYFLQSSSGKAILGTVKEYLDDDADNDRQLLVVNSVSTGGGKTQFLKEVAQYAKKLNKPALSTAPTQKLTKDNSKDFGHANYKDELSSTTETIAVGVCIMSLHKAKAGTGYMANANIAGGSFSEMLKLNGGGVFMIDEAQEDANSLFRNGKNKSPKEGAEELIACCKNSKVVVIQEATMNTATVEMFKSFMGPNTKVIRVAQAPATRNIGTASYVTRNQATTELVNAAKKGQRVAAACGHVKANASHPMDMTTLGTIINSRAPQSKPIHLSAESLSTVDSPAYNFDLENLYKYDVMLYSPVIGIGNSIRHDFINGGGLFDLTAFFLGSFMKHSDHVQFINRIRRLDHMLIVKPSSAPSFPSNRSVIAAANEEAIGRHADLALLEILNEMAEKGINDPGYRSDNFAGRTYEESDAYVANQVTNAKTRTLPESIEKWVAFQDALEAAEGPWKAENLATHLVLTGREMVTYEPSAEVAEADTILSEYADLVKKLEKKIKRLENESKLEKAEAVKQELAGIQAHIAELRFTSDATISSEEIMEVKQAGILQRYTDIAEAQELSKTRAIEVAQGTGNAPTLQEFRAQEKSAYHQECNGHASLDTAEKVEEFKKAGDIRGARNGSIIMDDYHGIATIQEVANQKGKAIVNSEDPTSTTYAASGISEVVTLEILGKTGLCKLMMEADEYCKEYKQLSIDSAPYAKIANVLRSMTPEQLICIGIGKLTEEKMVRTINSLMKRNGFAVESLGQKTIDGKKVSFYVVQIAGTTKDYNEAQKQVRQDRKAVKEAANQIVTRHGYRISLKEEAKSLAHYKEAHRRNNQ